MLVECFSVNIRISVEGWTMIKKIVGQDTYKADHFAVCSEFLKKRR